MQEQTPKAPTWVKDQLSQRHLLKDVLGRGGQGVVYKTSDPELLVKMPLKNGKEITDKSEIKAFQNDIDRLYSLPLDNSIHITKPLYLLDDYAGYVMQMMRDMQPIGAWLPQRPDKETEKKFVRPAWLSDDVPLASAYSLSEYAVSGGAKRRLSLLSQAAIELLKLHSVGVVFMDVSPENIFCSKAPGYQAVWLIDADNLRFEAVKAKNGVLTPQYGAPEIVNGQGGSRAVSDAYSFSVLAFKILMMTGPFDGALFQDDEDVDWAADDADDTELNLEQQAEHGLLPFIFDPDDDSNRPLKGLPHELILTPELLLYFQKMFGTGRQTPWMRPGFHSLPRLLASAADTHIQCRCGMSFYYQPISVAQTCSYCEQQSQSLLVANSYFYSQDGSVEHAWQWVSPLQDGVDLELPRRLSGSFEIDQHNTPLFEINCVEDDWFIYAAASDVKVDIADNQGRYRRLTTQWLLEKDQLAAGVQLYLHAPHSVVIEIKVEVNNAI